MSPPAFYGQLGEMNALKSEAQSHGKTPPVYLYGLRISLFVIGATIYLLPFMRLWLSSGVEGSIWCGAARIMQGQVFSRDYFEVMGPGSFYWLALFFQVFGVNFAAARICLFVSSLGIAVLMYMLARRVCAEHQILPCVILAAASFNSAWPGNSHHTDSTFFALLAVTCVMEWKINRTDWLLCVAGISAGLTTFTHQPKGLLLIIAILVWLWSDRRVHRTLAHSAITLLIGYAGTCLVAFSYFCIKGALKALCYANLIWPLLHYQGVNSVPYAQGLRETYWERWVPAQSGAWNVGLALVMVIPIFFILLTPLFSVAGILVAYIPRLSSEALSSEILLCSLCGFALWASEIHRMNIEHLVFGAPLFILVAVRLLSVVPAGAQFAMPLLILASSWLCLFNWVGVLQARQIATRAGTITAFRENATLDFLKQHESVGDTIFIYPYWPAGYFLSASKNPTRYSLLTYNYNLPAEFVDAIDTLKEQHPKYVIWDTEFIRKNERYLPGSNPSSSSQMIMEQYLESNYKTIESDDNMRIMVPIETSAR